MIKKLVQGLVMVVSFNLLIASNILARDSATEVVEQLFRPNKYNVNVSDEINSMRAGGSAETFRKGRRTIELINLYAGKPCENGINVNPDGSLLIPPKNFNSGNRCEKICELYKAAKELNLQKKSMDGNISAEILVYEAYYCGCP